MNKLFNQLTQAEEHLLLNHPWLYRLMGMMLIFAFAGLISFLALLASVK